MASLGRVGIQEWCQVASELLRVGVVLDAFGDHGLVQQQVWQGDIAEFRLADSVFELHPAGAAIHHHARAFAEGRFQSRRPAAKQGGLRPLEHAIRVALSPKGGLGALVGGPESLEVGRVHIGSHSEFNLVGEPTHRLGDDRQIVFDLVRAASRQERDLSGAPLGGRRGFTHHLHEGVAEPVCLSSRLA